MKSEVTHVSECSHITEKLTFMASQEGKGKTGEVKHGGNIDSVFLQSK